MGRRYNVASWLPGRSEPPAGSIAARPERSARLPALQINAMANAHPHVIPHHDLNHPVPAWWRARWCRRSNALRHRARGKRLLHIRNLLAGVRRSPPLAAHPSLDPFVKTALERPLTSLIRRLAHGRCRPTASYAPVSRSRPCRGCCERAREKYSPLSRWRSTSGRSHAAG
jgi:hypothetical protein